MGRCALKSSLGCDTHLRFVDLNDVGRSWCSEAQVTSELDMLREFYDLEGWYICA